MNREVIVREMQQLNENNLKILQHWFYLKNKKPGSSQLGGFTS